MPRFLRQFGLRTLLIFCTLAAVCFGLWRWHMTWVDQQHEVASQIADEGGSIRWKTWGPQWIHQAFGSYYFSEIVAVDLNHKRIGSKHLQLLRQIPTLEELYLPGTYLQGQSLEVLGDLPKLRKLALWNTHLDNDTLQHVGRLKHLDTLDIHRTAMTEAGLVHLRNHPRLKVIRHDMQISEVGVDHLSTIENLQMTHLVLHGGREKTFRQLREDFRVLVLKVYAPQTDQWAKYLAGHPTLVQLNVSDALVQNDQLAELLSANTLQSLSLENVPMDDATLCQVVGASRLTRLSLNGTDVTATGLFNCLGPAATEIDMRNNWIKLIDRSAKRDVDWSGSLTAADLPALANCRQATSLTFYSTNFPGTIDFTFLPELKSLENIRIGPVGDGPIMRNMGSLKKLETVVLFLYSNVTPDELAELASAKSLEVLVLPVSKIFDEHLRAIGTITQLKRLNIQGSKVTDEGMQSIVALQNLEQLDIAGCPELTDQSLRYIGQLKKLRKLDIANTNTTDKGLEHLYGMPNLSYVETTGTRLTTEGLRKLYDSLR